MRIKLLFFILLLTQAAAAQVADTIHTDNGKLSIPALKEGKVTYAVLFEDSTGKRLGSAELWDRTIRIVKDEAGNRQYWFGWDWYRQDSLMAQVTATGLLPSMKPLTHRADYFKRGKKIYQFNGNEVTVPDADKKNKVDSNFKVLLTNPAFEFPMDLEIFGLLPFRKVNQQFVIPFYEPGSPKSDYYRLTVTGKEDLPLPGGQKVNCWLLRIDYGKAKAYATFWISDKTREVLKMKEVYGSIRRYKVRLF